jgi:AraC-like DNA-binding protein
MQDATQTAQQSFAHGPEALRRLQDAAFDLCDTTPLSSVDNFHISSASRPLGNTLVVETRNSLVRYDRTGSHIARSGFDHYQVTVLREGTFQFGTGRREVTMHDGDICLCDMTQPSQSYMTDGLRLTALVLPRKLLAPLLETPDSLQGQLLTGNPVYGKLIRAQVSAMLSMKTPAAPSTISSSIETLAGLIANSLGPSRGAQEPVQRAAKAALFDSISRYIAQNLETEDIGIDDICRRFRVSRATVKRHFEKEGGLATYIQQQYLNRALRKMMSRSYRHARIIDLAVESGFSSDNTFIRAFRRAFGLTPGEVRMLSASRRQDRALSEQSSQNNPLTWLLGQAD